MSWFSEMREFFWGWHAESPWMTISLWVAFVAIVGIVSFKFLFVTAPKKSNAPGAIIFQGSRIEQLTIVTMTPPPTASAVSHAPQPLTEEPIVENGGFERGLEAWGSGWIESSFVLPAVVAFNGANAKWSIDSRVVRSGSRYSLRVEHLTAYKGNVYSTLSQRIRVKPRHRYEAKFWAYVEAGENFSLRVVPSRAHDPSDWDRNKIGIRPGMAGRWQERRVEFRSGADWFFDLRFAAEAEVRLWIDDVVVTALGPAEAGGD